MKFRVDRFIKARSLKFNVHCSPLKTPKSTGGLLNRSKEYFVGRNNNLVAAQKI